MEKEAFEALKEGQAIRIKKSGKIYRKTRGGGFIQWRADRNADYGPWKYAHSFKLANIERAPENDKPGMDALASIEAAIVGNNPGYELA